MSRSWIWEIWTTSTWATSAVPARVKLPAPKEEVASNTESDSASQDVVQQIRAAATERFNGPEEVMQAVRGSYLQGQVIGLGTPVLAPGRVTPGATNDLASPEIC